MVFDLDQVQAFEGHVVTVEVDTQDASLTGVVQDVGAWMWTDWFWIATGPEEGEVVAAREVTSLVDHGVEVTRPTINPKER